MRAGIIFAALSVSALLGAQASAKVAGLCKGTTFSGKQISIQYFENTIGPTSTFSPPDLWAKVKIGDLSKDPAVYALKSLNGLGKNDTRFGGQATLKSKTAGLDLGELQIMISTKGKVATGYIGNHNGEQFKSIPCDISHR